MDYICLHHRVSTSRHKWYPPALQVPTNMAGVRGDWLTNQNTDWCFVVIGLVGRQSHSPLHQLKIDPVRQLDPPYLLASSGCQRIFINIRGQYGIRKNIYIHPWSTQSWLALVWMLAADNCNYHKSPRSTRSSASYLRFPCRCAQNMELCTFSHPPIPNISYLQTSS